jgi:SAM-dependent methyltransferase
MTVFGNYARYYDLLYHDKDYAGEAQFIHNLIQSQAPAAQTILELGCGTGNHAMLLAKAGYDIHGVDLSLEMLEGAKQRCAQLPQELAAKLKFTQGDIRQVRIDAKFDVVLSLFHVISYQTTNEDLLAAFETAKLHLSPGGIMIFDVWYGPTVLSEPPVVRVKRLEDESIQVTRIAEPAMYPNRNCVDVNYQIFIKDKNNGAVEEIKETHTMRYLFEPELNFLTAQSRMKIIDRGEWMTMKELGIHTWGAVFVVQL